MCTCLLLQIFVRKGFFWRRIPIKNDKRDQKYDLLIPFADNLDELDWFQPAYRKRQRERALSLPLHFCQELFDAIEK